MSKLVADSSLKERDSEGSIPCFVEYDYCCRFESCSAY